MSNFTKENIEILINENIFDFSKTQTDELNNFVKKYDNIMIDLINESHYFTQGTNIVEYLNQHLNDDDILKKITLAAKKTFFMQDLDLSKVKDNDKFIKNYLEELPAIDFTCSHIRLINLTPKDKDELLKYILNEKTNINIDFNLYTVLEVFDLINDKIKMDLAQQYNEKKHHLIHRNHLGEKQSQNLLELEELAATLKQKPKNKMKT